MSLRFFNPTSVTTPTQDGVLIAPKPNTANLPKFTVLTWVLIAGSITDHTIYNREAAGTFQRRLAIVAPAKVRGQVRRAGGPEFKDSLDIPDLLQAGKWIFAAMTYSMDAEGIQLYAASETRPPRNVGGTPSVGTGALTDDSTVPLLYGRSKITPAAGDGPIQGYMAAAGLWNRAMPLNEIVSQWAHMRPSTGCVDFHVFRNTGRQQNLPDLTETRTGNPGVQQSSSMSNAMPGKYTTEPALEIY